MYKIKESVSKWETFEEAYTDDIFVVNVTFNLELGVKIRPCFEDVCDLYGIKDDERMYLCI